MKTTRTAPRALCALVALALSGAALPARAALKYDVGDYVQQGLVVHLDGIRNVGADKPHDPAAAMWANLADRANPAAITANASSGWRADGYNFTHSAGVSYAQLVSDTPAMTQATFEIAVDASLSGQNTTSWGSYFLSWNGNTRGVCLVNDSGNKLMFDAIDWTGNSGNAGRSQIGSWGWKQAAFSLGAAGKEGLRAYDAGTSADSRSRSTATEGSIPAAKWRIANRGDSPNAARQFYGTVRSVRIYNRALDPDEVAANAAIDAARFEGVMPVTNAVVSTSVAGAEGTEGNGVYAVDGSHVFTAPPSRAVSGKTYALAGCTVAAWDDAAGDWGAAESRDGVYAVAVSEGEKVRIVWNWTETAATLGGYVEDGLVVWLDGIWNAGRGKPHSMTATQWANLADASNPAAITKNARTGWRDDGYFFSTNSSASTTDTPSYAQLVSAAPAMTQATFEFAVEADASQYSSWGRYFVSGTNGNAICCFDVNDGGVKHYLGINANQWTGGSGNTTRARVTSDSWSWKQASFTLGAAGADGMNAYDLGVEKDSRTRTSAAAGSVPDTRWMVGNRFGETTVTARQLIGTVKAVRIYNRALSAAEVARNAAVDDARFFSLTGGVEVVADPRGLAGREPAGFYTPDGWTFSAGTATQTVGGVFYAPAGCVVESWDADSSSWVFEASSESSAYTPPAAPFANRRLTWLWKPVSGIRRASDYTANDYARGGMKLWFDGIRNAGLDADHADAATTWRELVSGGTAEIIKNDKSHWTTDGYHFCLGSDNASLSYARYLKFVSLGTVGTIELSSDVDQSAQDTDNGVYWPRYVAFNYVGNSTDNDMSIFSQQRQTDLRWKADTWSGGNGNARANVSSPWDGKHAAFVMDTAELRSYKTGTLDQTAARASVSAMPAAYWTMGNKYWGTGNTANQLTGTMKTLRAYSRVLSDAEIAWNYEVDAARFDGALAVTNVVVAASDFNGDLAADAYRVFGSHVFEAAPAADGSLPNRVKVWTLVDGDWVPAEVRMETSYAYDASTRSDVVKIEFGKTSPLVLVVR